MPEKVPPSFGAVAAGWPSIRRPSPSADTLCTATTRTTQAPGPSSEDHAPLAAGLPRMQPQVRGYMGSRQHLRQPDLPRVRARIRRTMERLVLRPGADDAARSHAEPAASSAVGGVTRSLTQASGLSASELRPRLLHITFLAHMVVLSSSAMNCPASSTTSISQRPRGRIPQHGISCRGHVTSLRPPPAA